MGIFEDDLAKKKRKFRVVMGPRTILMGNVTKAEAEKRIKNIRQKRNIKDCRFFEIFEKCEIEDMEV